ncbi:MAG: SCO family protein [Acidobacteriota bacterium]
MTTTLIRHSRAWAAASLALLLVAACSPPQQWNGTLADPPQPAPELLGVNWNGEAFSLSDHLGKVAIVFFGYTMCPDVCPFTLAKIKQVVGELGEQADDLAVVFVSVDPHRDSVERLARYVPNFNDRFYGLHLDVDQVDALKASWEVTIQYGQPKDGPGTDSFYYVDHTGTYFVVDREGQLRLTFPPNATAAQMTPDIRALLTS